MAEFQRGDIVCNRYAGERNSHRYLLYLGESTITQGRYRSRGYTCLTHDAEKIQLFRDNDPLYRVGHMASPEWKGWAEIRKMREAGLSWEDIGSRLDVSYPTLRKMRAKAGVKIPAPKRPRRNGGGYVAKRMTLCWQCVNAVPDKSGKRGCAWSRSFKPVPGWDADETRLYAGDEARSIVSYHVRSCPEFVEG